MLWKATEVAAIRHPTPGGASDFEATVLSNACGLNSVVPSVPIITLQLTLAFKVSGKLVSFWGGEDVF